MDAILGAPPPPPEPGTDSFQGKAADPSLTAREQLEIHRSKRSCAVCHSTMDELGFSLESFDPLGRLRTAPDGSPVDDRASLPDGRTFKGPLELSELLLQGDGFLRGLAENLIVYSVGRPLDRGDHPKVDALLLSLETTQPTLEQLILTIIASDLFKNREDQP